MLGRDDDYLNDTLRALNQEWGALKNDQGAPTRIEEGERLSHDQRGAFYRFRLTFDTVLPEGVPIQLEVGGRRWTTEVLTRNGLKIILYVHRDQDRQLPESVVRHAGLYADPIHLLEALRDRTQEIQDDGVRSQPAARLLGLLSGSATASDMPSDGFRNPNLNGEQNEAIGRCATNDVWFVWGPPGTGKTTTLGHVIAQAVDHGERVLVTAHSNVAVDAALLATYDVGVRSTEEQPVVRSGPAALDEARACGLGAREQVRARFPELADELDALVDRFERGDGLPSELRNQWSDLSKRLRQAETDLVSSARVVFATLSKALVDTTIADRVFDLVVVDEVSMTYPAQVLVVADQARRRVNVFGDCRQLPPIVKSKQQSTIEYLARDVFTACGADEPGVAGVTMLVEQYRMHPDIRDVVSRMSYSGRLRDGPGIAEDRTIKAERKPFPRDALVWVDTSTFGARWFTPANRRSRFNPVSALIAISVALDVEGYGVDPVLLSPYVAQVRLLSALALDAGLADVTVGTVHRYQGSEAQVVIIDMVDTSDRKLSQLFPGDRGRRLLNVGISRAQNKTIIVGDRNLPFHDTLAYPVRTALDQIRQARCTRPDRPKQRTRPSRFSISIHDEKPLPDQKAARSVVAAAAPPAAAEVREHLGPLVETWIDGHPWWTDEAGHLVLLAGNTRRPATFELTWARRTANVLHDLVIGDRLARTGSPGEQPAKATRHDQCGHCGGDAVPYRSGPYSVELVCQNCARTRWASDREVVTWLRHVGPRCPTCRSAMSFIDSRRAPGNPFLGCTAYPDCRGTRRLDDLVAAVASPDPPPQEMVSTSPQRRKRTAMPTRMCQNCMLTKPMQQFEEDSTLCVDCA